MPPFLRHLLVIAIAALGAAHMSAAQAGASACLAPAWNIAEGDRFRATAARDVLAAMALRDVVLLK